VVAGTGFDCAFRHHDRLFRAFACAHQQPDCPLAAGFPTSRLAGVAPALGWTSCHPGQFFGCGPDSPGFIICYLTNGNQLQWRERVEQWLLQLDKP
jgi:hypothetical protein